jgi:protein phosphatase
VRILLISDVHGNLDALTALQEPHDEVWVLGDLVNYGPQPQEVVHWVQEHASNVVRGNHDHAIGFDANPRCSPRFREMAAATSQFTSSVLDEKDKDFLRRLRLSRATQVDRTRFYLCHAMPSDPLFGYCAAESSRWEDEIQGIEADVILVGHTHVPAVRRIGGKVVINPGSLGQPKIGRPETCYAIWEDGHIELKTCPYPFESTIAKVQAMPIPQPVRDDLIAILRTGSIPEQRETKRAS